MELTMKVEGPILSKLANAPASAKAALQAGMLDASTYTMEASIRETPASTGTLRKSIRREFSNDGLTAAIFPAVDYGAFLHGPFDSAGGRSRPFTIPAKEAMPGGTLYRWAQKKGMNPWAVRASIAKKGVKFNPYLKRAADDSSDGVKNIFVGVLDKIAATLGD
jgi:hypothetical protein